MYQLPVPDDLYSHLLQQCYTVAWRKTEDGSRSVSSISDNAEFADVISWINDSIADVYNDIYEEPYAQGLQVSDAWLNRSETGDETLLHTHPWSIISGVLYITGDDGSTIFVQNNPYDTVNQMSMSKRYHIKQECPIANGTMILFPSTLQHFVPVNRSREVRHTLSFNTMPSAVDDGHLIRWHS